MSNNKISQIKLPNNNEIYDIEGRNIQRISWSDYSNLSEEDKKSNTAYYITNIPLDEGGYKHEEGSVIAIDDGKLNAPLKDCTVDINPVQSGSGTPSPSNIRPISGWTEANITVAGKNLYDETQTLIKGRYTSDGSIAETSSELNKHTGLIKIQGGKTYTYYNAIPYTAQIYGVWFDADKQYISTFALPKSPTTASTATAPNNACYVALSIYNETNQKVQFEVGVTATEYEAYNDTTYNIEFEDGGSPLTVYGGRLNVTIGELTVDMVSIDLSSISSFSSDAVNANGFIRYNCLVDDKALNFNLLCSKLEVSSTVVRSNTDTEEISGSSTNNRFYFSINADRLSGDLSTTSGRNQALKTLLQTDDIQVVYELATPTEVSLTPTEITTLYGNDVIWADSGDMAITYTYESNNQIRMGDEIFSVGSNAQTISGHTVLTDVPADAVFTDTTYSVTPVTISTAQKGSDITVDDITAWNAGSVTTVTYNETTHSIIINNGVLPSLSYTAKNVPNITTENIQVVKDVSVVNSNITDG